MPNSLLKVGTWFYFCVQIKVFAESVISVLALLFCILGIGIVCQRIQLSQHYSQYVVGQDPFGSGTEKNTFKIQISVAPDPK